MYPMAGLTAGFRKARLGKEQYRKIALGLRRLTPAAKSRAEHRRNIFLMVLFCAFAVMVIRAANAHAVYLVKVDGSPIGLVQDKDVYQSILARLSESEAAKVGAEVKLTSKVTLEPAPKGSEQRQLTEDELAQALRERISFLASGYVITVNGRDVVALASEEQARSVISDLRGTYAQAVASEGNATLEDIYIREDVGIAHKEVPSSMFRKEEEAVRVLSRGTDKVLSYVVQRGDSLWSIAQANNMTLDDLLKANPEIRDSEFIREGQNLNLVVADPYVTVASKEIVKYTVSIPYSVEVSYDPNMWPWQERVTQEGVSGRKEITQEIARENGKEISRVTISEKVLSYPVTCKLVRGSKQVPPMGSGQMAWPVQGQITSYYGWRWGEFHQGVDIGADTGTPIIAADSGMISFAGWNGGYGYLVKIDHGGGKETWYGHMSKIAVHVGDEVSKGDVIGYVGSTGNSTGPHLHFEVHVNGATKDPLSFYK